jgi:hypothetical protein
MVRPVIFRFKLFSPYTQNTPLPKKQQAKNLLLFLVYNFGLHPGKEAQEKISGKGKIAQGPESASRPHSFYGEAPIFARGDEDEGSPSQDGANLPHPLLSPKERREVK